jgi:hypothetical protein
VSFNAIDIIHYSLAGKLKRYSKPVIMRYLFVLLTFLFLQSCGESDQGGVVNDGIQTVDSNGALDDSTPNQPLDPSIDTSKGENRVDIQQRDNSKTRADTLR